MGQAATTGAANPNAFAGENAALSGIQGMTSLANSIQQAGAAKAEAAYTAQQLEFNAKVADYQGQDAIRRGEKAANAVRREGRKIQGAQRAAFAAQGIDPNSGSAADVQADTKLFSELDALTVKTNAFREAFGYKAEAMGFKGKAVLEKFAGDVKANNTLVTGGLSAIKYGSEAANWASKVDWSK